MSNTLNGCSLFENAFAVLETDQYASRGEIIEAAETAALSKDEQAVQQARSVLTNPRMRLASEMEWLPGIPAEQIPELLKSLEEGRFQLDSFSGMSELARANAQVAKIELSDYGSNAVTAASDISSLIELSDLMDAYEIFDEINEDREQAGIPAVLEEQQVAEKLEDIFHRYAKICIAALDRMETEAMVKAATSVTSKLTSEGTEAAPTLLADIIDAYSLASQEFQTKAEESMDYIYGKVWADASNFTKAQLVYLADQMKTMISDWAFVMQPILLVDKTRGKESPRAMNIANDLRSIGIKLNNKHHDKKSAIEITQFLLTTFSSCPDIYEKLLKDKSVLARN